MTKTDSPPERAAAAGTALLLCKDAPTRQLILESLHPLAILPGDLRGRFYRGQPSR